MLSNVICTKKAIAHALSPLCYVTCR